MLKLNDNTINHIVTNIVDLILTNRGKIYHKNSEGGGQRDNILKSKRMERWLAFIDRVTKDEIPFRNDMVKYFKEQEIKVLESLGTQKAINKDINDISNIPKKKDELKKLAALSTPKIIKAVASEGTFILEELGISIGFDVLNPKVIEYVETRVGDLIKEISDTTKEALRLTLKEGEEAGENISKLADRISLVYEDAQGYRAELIARTENITAHNNGALNGYRQSGIVEKKSWLTAGDDRVRPEHVVMNGETVGIEETFSNGLMYPSEPNCRCTIVPIISKE